MILTPQEESLIGVIRQLPATEAGKVLEWARQLGQLADGQPVDWSDVWTDQDIAEVTKASLDHFEHHRERQDRWSRATSSSARFQVHS